MVQKQLHEGITENMEYVHFILYICVNLICVVFKRVYNKCVFHPKYLKIYLGACFIFSLRPERRMEVGEVIFCLSRVRGSDRKIRAKETTVGDSVALSS